MIRALVAPQNPKTLSIVIPHYEEVPHLKDCLRHLTLDRTDHTEILVVDDHSHTSCKLLSLMAKNPQVRFLYNDRPRGPAYCKNRGAEAAVGEWIWFLEATSKPLTGAVSEMRRAIQSAKNHSVIWCGQGKETDSRSFAIRRESLLRIGGFKESFLSPILQHYDLAYRLRASRLEVRFAGNLLDDQNDSASLRQLRQYLLRTVAWVGLRMRYSYFTAQHEILS